MHTDKDLILLLLYFYALNLYSTYVYIPVPTKNISWFTQLRGLLSCTTHTWSTTILTTLFTGMQKS